MNQRNYRIIILLLLSLGVYCFSEKTSLDTLSWVDQKTHDKLFDIEDIVRFDWDKQVFELTRPAAMSFMAALSSVPVEGRKFILKDSRSVIYEGTLITSISSFAITGPVIRSTLPDDRFKPPLFRIDGGYPRGLEEGDTRFSVQLKKALEQAKVLGAIDLNNPPQSIETITHGWFGENDKLRVLVEIFPETFRLCELARAHLHIIGIKHLDTPDYVLDVNVTLSANNGKFKYSTNRIFSAHNTGWKSIYAIAMNPWVSDENPEDKHAKAGPAEISLDICIRKIVDAHKGLYSEPLESVNTGPIQIVIISQQRNEVLSEPKAVMNEFQQALRASEWNKALSFCSDAVQSEAKKYESPEVFFKDIVPVEQIISVSDIQTSGGQFGPENERLAYFCCVQLSEPNAPPAIYWDWKLNRTDAGWAVDFKSIPLDSWVEQETLRLQQENERALQKENILREGLKLTLIPLNDSFIIGSPMRFRLEMTNISDESIQYEKTFFLMINNPMTVTAPDGKQLISIDSDVQTGLGPHVNINPGQSVILADEYDVTNQYQITQPGQYTIQFTRHSVLKSNIVKMNVKPGQLAQLDTVVEKLRSILPNDWALTRKRLHDIADFDSKTDRIMSFNLIGKSRKGTPEDTVAVFILINPTQSFLEKTDHESEFWGQSQWGPVYVRAVNAELLWSNYKQQIAKALDIDNFNKSNVP